MIMNCSTRFKIMVSYELRWINFGARTTRPVPRTPAENVVGYTVMDGIVDPVVRYKLNNSQYNKINHIRLSCTVPLDSSKWFHTIL